MTRQKQSRETLKMASKAIAHEIKSLRMAMDAHDQYHRQGGHPVIVMNALVTTFAINFRNILDFMYSGRNIKNPPKKSDVVAEDFFDSPQVWHDALEAYPARARDNKQRLNKQITHITYDKLNLDIEDRLWHFDSIMNDLSPAIQAFYRNVDWEFFVDVEAEFKHPLWIRRVRMLFR